MKILIVSQYYPPENALIAPALARALADRGHEVRVVTGYPNYPLGRVFDGYRQRWRSYELDGKVSLCRVPLFADHSQRPIRRIANYLSFGLSASTARRFATGADVIYVYATQMTAALGPWLWRLTGGAPYVLHVQDLWPDSVVGSSLVAPGRASRAVASLLDPWIASVYRRAAMVVAIAPTMVATLDRRGVPKDKLRLVFNWASEQSCEDAPAVGDAGDSSVTRVLYAGNVGDMQDLETAVEAAHRAADEGVRLTILGDGVALPRVRALAERLGCSNIEFRAPVPRHEMAEAYRCADFALVTLKDLPAFRGTIPSKMQAALAHGVPVISTVQGDVRSLVEEMDIGFTADAQHVLSLEQAFRAAARAERSRSAMARRARLTYSDRFSEIAGVSAIESILREATQSRQPGSEKPSAAVTDTAIGGHLRDEDR